MTYSSETIKHLTKLIQGNEESRLWLQKNNFHELILLHYYLNGYEDSLKKNLINKSPSDSLLLVEKVSEGRMCKAVVSRFTLNAVTPL